MWSRVYLTVRCPSVYLFQHGPTAANPLLQVCCCGPGKQETAIDCCTVGAQQQRRAVGECGQCHVVSVRRKLNTDFICSTPECIINAGALCGSASHHDFSGVVFLQYEPGSIETAGAGVSPV